ncbi:MAG: hypothetical protein ACPGNT_03580 [Rhodospirillales bacterium]
MLRPIIHPLILTCFVSAALLALSACGVVTAAGSVGSLATQKKTIPDQVISLASGKDCSSVRVEQGLTYCKEDEKVPNPKMFCYQTLGSVTCYEEPDARYQQIDSNKQNSTR